MPIYNVGECKQLHFGYGDIDIAGGYLKGEQVNRAGVLVFMKGNEGSIGSRTEYNPAIQVPVSKTPVRMVFEVTESIDVLIRELEKTKQLMIDSQITLT